MKCFTLILLSSLLLVIACANKSYPEEKPFDIYVPAFDKKVFKYKMGLGQLKEEVSYEDIKGAMCMKMDAWQEREIYIDKLKKGY